MKRTTKKRNPVAKPSYPKPKAGTMKRRGEKRKETKQQEIKRLIEEQSWGEEE